MERRLAISTSTPAWLSQSSRGARYVREEATLYATQTHEAKLNHVKQKSCPVEPSQPAEITRNIRRCFESLSFGVVSYAATAN